MNIEENMEIEDMEMDSILDEAELLDNPRTISATKYDYDKDGVLNDQALMNELSKLAQE